MTTRLENAAGLRVEINANGSVRRMDCGDIILNLFLGNEIEGGPASIYLRRLGRRIEWIPLLGPQSPADVELDEHGLTMRGLWKGLRFALSLVLAPDAPAWLWRVELANVSRRATAVDLVYAQDIALAHYGMVRLNEYYVSQYVDYTPLQHSVHGTVLAMRQNLAMGGRHPWGLIGSLNQGRGFASDALQLFGTSMRSGAAPPPLNEKRLGSKRLQHEHSMAIIQDAPVRLAAGESAQRGFFGWFDADHPDATSTADLAWVDKAIAAVTDGEGTRIESSEGEGEPPGEPPVYASRPTTRLGGSLALPRPDDRPRGATLFTACSSLACLDLTDADLTELFGSERRHAEYRDGRLHSFFTDACTHVVLKAKELSVLRPHGHILRTGSHLTPDEASLTTTVWMDGVFNSMVTQGHVSINRFLSTTHSYLGLFRSHGQRLFVQRSDGYARLAVPSAFAMTAAECRWIYKHDAGLIEVRTAAASDRHAITLSARVLRGAPCRFLVSHHVALNGDDGADAIPARFARDGDAVVAGAIAESDVGRRFPEGTFRIDPGDGTVLEQVGGDELLFMDGATRGEPFLVIVTTPATAVALRITGQLLSALPSPGPATGDACAGCAGDVSLSLRPPPESPLATDVTRIEEVLPWLAHNALVHYLAPRGLEQYSGGGWGTRDVCQGPVEMLLALGAYAPVRDLLLRVFAAQNPDGDWPQWFMFFERERNIRPGDSHGDIVFWPLLALGRYLLASGDAGLLDETVPFFHADVSAADSASIWEHVERALGVIAARVIPGTHLAAYGHGDWNDSLQPADPDMRERLCSAWTVTLHHER
jgi:cellobiose phosphorylase